MNKVAHYLQEHVSGEVLTSSDARKYFSTDGSVFVVAPSVILYPRNEQDIRKTTRFAWQLAERGRIIPLTARGLGTDQGGAAIGSGVIIVFPAHMNRMQSFDSKHGQIVVEPGMNFGKLQLALQTHGRFLPSYPASLEYSTIGGAVANNASGEKSIKYGSMRRYVKGLRVVLANGEVIETERLNKKELSKKLGQPNFEGEIYRSLDKLLEENEHLVGDYPLKLNKNTAGYDVWDVINKDGSFDLTPLFVGSQGTLGIVTEVMLSTEALPAETTLIAAFVDDLQTAEQVMLEINESAEKPSALEMVDGGLLQFIDEQNPNQLKGVVDKPFAKLILLIEFDDATQRVQKKAVRNAQKILSRYELAYHTESDDEAKEKLWKIRHSAASVLAHVEGNAKALPVIDDGIVPPYKFNEYLQGIYEICARNHIKPAVWGHAGNANLHLRPILDLAEVGDRQKVFKLIDDYYSLVIKLGGSTSGQLGDGRLRAPYLPQVYGDEVYGLFKKVKEIFDPYNIMNPGVKIDVTLDDIKPLLRSDYSMEHLYNHLPRT